MTAGEGPDVSLVEIAQLQGVTNQRTSVIGRRPGFAAPPVGSERRRLCDRREVTARAKVWRRKQPWGPS